MPLDNTTTPASPELQELVARLNAQAGRQKATIHTGELMRPAGAPAWREAKAQAIAAVFAECRSSHDPCWRPVHLGDWFERTAMVRSKDLPAAIKAGYSTAYSPALRKIIVSRTIHDMRLPLPRFWHPAWRPVITAAIAESGGP